jgi:Fe-S-cluster containining protein
LDAFSAELVALYARVDALYADWSCPGSTECCRFGITGRQPYVTAIELSLIRHALARRGGPLSARRRALPLHADAADERTCALLDRSGRCSVYAQRPLGCRTFYCGRAQRGAGPTREDLRELVHELQDLAARHQLGGELARPLMHALEAG